MTTTDTAAPERIDLPGGYTLILVNGCYDLIDPTSEAIAEDIHPRDAVPLATALSRPSPAEIEGLVDAYGLSTAGWASQTAKDGDHLKMINARRALLDAIARLSEARPAPAVDETFDPEQGLLLEVDKRLGKAFTERLESEARNLANLWTDGSLGARVSILAALARVALRATAPAVETVTDVMVEAEPPVQMIPEDPRHRSDFNSEVKRLFGGSPLRRIAAGLTMAYQLAPEFGAYRQMMGIYANECSKAATALDDALRDSRMAQDNSSSPSAASSLPDEIRWDACKLMGWRQGSGNWEYLSNHCENRTAHPAVLARWKEAKETALRASRATLAVEAVTDAMVEASFLLERLADFENEHMTDGPVARDWYGHVEPCAARLKDLLASDAALRASRPVQGTIAVVGEDQEFKFKLSDDMAIVDIVEMEPP